MIGKEIIDLINENPGLEIRAMVYNEVCCGDEYSYWYAPNCKAKVEEVVMEKVINDERLWIKSEDYDYMIDMYYDCIVDIKCDTMEDIFDNDGVRHAAFKDRPNVYLDEEYLLQLSEEYVNNLPWEKCILLYLDV